MRLEPTVPQHEFITSKCRYPLMLAGYGAGKTEALINRRLIQAFQYPKNDFAFYEPTYDLIRQIAYPRFEEKLEELRIPYKLIKSPTNELHIAGCGRIIFRSMDTPARIIGYEVADSDVDELDTLKRDDAAEVWRRVLARNRQKKHDQTPNTVAVATTPEGFRFVYEAWEKEPKPGYEIIRAPTSSNLKNLPSGYIDSLRDMYPPNLLDAYLDGKFVNLTSGTVYTSFNRVDCGSSESIQPNEPLYIGMDFNVGNMSSVIHVMRDGMPHAVSEISQGYDTPQVGKIIKQQYKDAGHAIYVYPDSSGGSRSTKDASTTDIQILRQFGFTVRAKGKNPPIKDRVNAMNAAFVRGYKVNTALCPEYTRSLEQQAYDKNGMPDKTQGLDHHNDAGGYFINYEMPIVRPVIQSHAVASGY